MNYIYTKTIYLLKPSPSEDSTIFSPACNEVRLISETNVLLPPQTIAVVVTKSTYSPKTLEMRDKFTNFLANPFSCIGSPSLYTIPILCAFPETEVNKMLLFMVNIGHEEMKIIKGCTLAYLTPAQYENFQILERTKKV